MLQYVHHLLVNRVCLLLDAEQRAENICMQLLKKKQCQKTERQGKLWHFVSQKTNQWAEKHLNLPQWQLEQLSLWKIYLWLLIWVSSFTLHITISPAVDIWLYLGNIIQKYTAEKQKEDTRGKRGSNVTKVSCEIWTKTVVVGWYVSGTRM